MSDEHKPMTDEEQAAIQGRLNAITQPPWKNCNSTYYGMVMAGNKEVALASYYNCVYEDCRVTREDQAANAEFIAHAPDDIARLLAEVERLRDENEMLGAANEKLDFQRFLAERRVEAMLAKGMEGKYVWQHNAENRWCPFNLERLCPGVGCMAWIPKIDENGREYSDYGRCVRLIGEENNAE